jgi:hypothetical protein
MSDRPPSSIQVLIADINRILRQPLAVWRLYPQAVAQRQLLERTREVLALWPTNAASSASTLPVNANEPGTTDTTNDTSTAAINGITASLLAPLQADIQTLTAQRQSLQQEVTQLEATKQLQQQQMMAPLIQQVEDLETFHDQANQILQSLDSTLKLTFTGLEQDAASYQRSLAQRLSQLYEMGEQSETVIAHLLQQLVTEIQELAQNPPQNALRAAEISSTAQPLTTSPSTVVVSEISRSAESSSSWIEPAATSANLEQPAENRPATQPPETITSLTELLSKLRVSTD